MEFQQIKPMRKVFFVFLATLLIYGDLTAQVNTVEYGKNRVQFRKFKWQYYQSTNFNTYFYENGKTIANFVAQVAEEELPAMEQFVEYGLQRRANIAIYNTFDELQQSNIGLNLDWQTTGGLTKLVNNKMIVYFDGNHENLRKQIRQGIARTLVDNLLFGDDLGEFAANQALLDLPKWLVDGYVEYAGENWSTNLDNELKLALLSGDYKNFYQFAFEKPMLAGHAFWNYIAETYKKENVTYFLYLARVYRNLNTASSRIAKKKFKDVLKDFMDKTTEKYYADLKGRRDAPKGAATVVEEVKHNRDYFRFTANPAPRSMTYAVVEFVKGQHQVVLWTNMVDRKVLLKSGVKSNENEVNPNYPLLAWNGKGTKLGCVYWKEGKVHLFVYDMVVRFKRIKQEVTPFEQILDMKYGLDDNTLLISAVRNGQTDIYIYKIDSDSYEQVTNDVYSDLDPSFVAFPSKTGIIFSSNRPGSSVDLKHDDTTVPTNRYNIFLADNWNKSEFRQISQLTNMQYGDARFPMQYNTSHFTFVSDQTGIANRFAGFFHTQRAGVDTVFIVGDEILRNPNPQDLDSTLKAWGKNEPDSMFSFSMTKDSSYVFPITNYASNLLETKIAGDKGMISETRQQGNLKFLYRLRIDETALKRRNVNPKPTEYRKRILQGDITKSSAGQAIQLKTPGVRDTTGKNDAFETGFEKEPPVNPPTTEEKPRLISAQDSAVAAERIASIFDTPGEEATGKEPILRKAKLFDYKLKFSVDNFSGGFNNDVLISRYQIYTGSLPVSLQNGSSFNGMIKASIFDLFEDIRFTGAFRLPLIGGLGSGGGASIGNGGVGLFVPVNQSLFDGGSEWFARIDYLKHRLDYSLLYYRKTELGNVPFVNGNFLNAEAKSFTNLYQAVIKYPFDKVRSLRLSVGVRTDKVLLRTNWEDLSTLDSPEVSSQTYAVSRLEWVHDNTIQKAMNILNGLRYKIYADMNAQVNKPDQKATNTEKTGRFMTNIGFDARYYFPIYRNFIWAVRGAGDMSFGDKKIIYYLGGSDGWLFPKYYSVPTPQDPSYAYQSLAVNLRGFKQNIANGNNALVINSELRFPVFATLINRPINNAFLRNFQVIQFFDLGTAWNGEYNKLARPSITYASDINQPNPVYVKSKAGGIGPFAGTYGFGVRSMLLGYFLRLDAGWEMGRVFAGKPMLHFAMGVDF